MKITHANTLLLLCISIYFNVTYAQDTMPGGVKGVRLWNKTKKISENQAKWASALTNAQDTDTLALGTNIPLNFNPAIYFTTGMKAQAQAIDIQSLPAFSIFTVCQQQDTSSEQALLCLENDTSISMVLTDKRMAAVSAYKYSNFGKKNKHIPRLYFYAQNTSKDTSVTARYLRVGQTPRSKSLPIEAFNGTIPEMMVFNRVLTLKERNRIESYLALKYGISLNQTIPVSYLNSHGQIIWDANANTAYSNNIAGIGRDDLSGLNQEKTESVQTPGIMTIEVQQAFDDNHFYTWGDNGGALKFKTKTGCPRQLAREWNISAFGSGRKAINSYTQVLSLEEIDPLDEGETYWMMIDRSGTGTYPVGQVSYIKCDSMTSANGTISFRSVVPDADSSGNDIFTIIAAPDLFTRNIIKASDCAMSSRGSIRTEIVGGTAPYHLQLYTSAGTSTLADVLVNQSSYVFDNLNQDAYVLKVTDASRQSASEKLWVSNQHTWTTPISDSYDLIEGQALTIDASANMPAGNYLYSWLAPNGSVSDGSTLSICSAGNYQLTITDENGCSSIIPFSVTQTGKSNFEKVEVFPNPSATGWFTVRLTLYREADVNVTIATLQGKVISHTTLSGNNYYSYSDQVKDQGVYLVSLVSQGTTYTLKLVVQP
jgi:hypothetical protein